MRNPNRIDGILAELKRIWLEFPDLRLGQLIDNLGNGVYFMEDDELIAALKKLYNIM